MSDSPEETYLLLAAPFSNSGKLPDMADLRYIPLRCAEEEINIAVGMASEQHQVQVFGVVSKTMALGMLKTMEDFERELKP